MAYPRVLVISAAALNTMSATGVTMVNLFKGWPLDRIAQVSWDDSRPNPEICANYMRISHKDVPLVNMVKQLAHFSKFARSSATSIQPHGSVDVHSACKPA